MVSDLMLDGFTSASIIDWYMLRLQRRPNAAKGLKSLYISALAWTCVRDKASSKESMLDELIENQDLEDLDYIFIPINTSKRANDPSGFHWTLLVLDYQTREWMHYNSLDMKMDVDMRYEDAVKNEKRGCKAYSRKRKDDVGEAKEQSHIN